MERIAPQAGVEHPPPAGGMATEGVKLGVSDALDDDAGDRDEHAGAGQPAHFGRQARRTRNDADLRRQTGQEEQGRLGQEDRQQRRLPPAPAANFDRRLQYLARSTERLVGNEMVSQVRTRWSPY